MNTKFIQLTATCAMLFAVASCSSKSESFSKVYQTRIEGYAEKGIFKQGSTVIATVYKDAAFENILETINGEVTGNDGFFKVSGNIRSKYVKMTVSGKFADETSFENEEVEGEISAILDPETESTININVLTDLEIEGTIENLRKGTRESIAEARKEALQEILAGLGIENYRSAKVIAKKATKTRLSGTDTDSEDGEVELEISTSIILAAKGDGKSISNFLNEIKTAIKNGRNTELTALLNKVQAKKSQAKANMKEYKENVRNRRKNYVLAKTELTTIVLTSAYLQFLAFGQGTQNLNPQEGLTQELKTEAAKEAQELHEDLVAALGPDDPNILDLKIKTFSAWYDGLSDSLKATFHEIIAKRLETSFATSSDKRKLLHPTIIEIAETNDTGAFAIIKRYRILEKNGKSYLYLYLKSAKDLKEINTAIATVHLDIEFEAVTGSTDKSGGSIN